MNNYEEIVGIKTRFENSTETELYGYLYSFQNKWVLTDNKNLNLFVSKCFENFDLREDYNYEMLNTNYKKCLYNVVYLQQCLITTISEEKFDEISSLFNKIFESIDYACKILKMGNIVMNSHSSECVEIKDDLGQLRFLQPNIDTNSHFQNLLLYIIDENFVLNPCYQYYKGL